MQTKTLAAILIGFGLGAVAMKIVHHFEKPRIVEVGIPEWEFAKSGPRVRDRDRRPDIYGRREIF